MKIFSNYLHSKNLENSIVAKILKMVTYLNGQFGLIMIGPEQQILNAIVPNILYR